MSAASRPLTFRLFVSSTLSDTKKKREVLQARISSKLRDFAALHLDGGISHR